MPTVNERLVSEALAHEVGMRRYGRNLLREVMGLLNEADRELVATIDTRLRRIAERGFDPGPFTTRRLEAMLGDVRKTNRSLYQRLGLFMRRELAELQDAEIDAQFDIFGEALNASVREGRKAAVRASRGSLEVSIVRPPMNQLVALIEHKPVQGRFLRQWVADLAEDKVRRINNAINQGIVQGESIEQMVRRLRGTKAGAFRDGILQISRDHAETWVRTSVGQVANDARDALYAENADILAGVAWVATLDDATCAQCLPRDGKLYSLDHRPIGHGIPWGAGPGRLHPKDRCTSVPQTKTYRQLGLDADEGAEGLRAAFGGPVSRKTTAEDWFRQHPEAAVRLYGKERAQLFLEGGVKASDLIDGDGDMWTLKELRAREKEAYRRAGLERAA